MPRGEQEIKDQGSEIRKSGNYGEFARNVTSLQFSVRIHCRGAAGSAAAAEGFDGAEGAEDADAGALAVKAFFSRSRPAVDFTTTAGASQFSKLLRISEMPLC